MADVRVRQENSVEWTPGVGPGAKRWLLDQVHLMAQIGRRVHQVVALRRALDDCQRGAVTRTLALTRPITSGRVAPGLRHAPVLRDTEYEGVRVVGQLHRGSRIPARATDPWPPGLESRRMGAQGPTRGGDPTWERASTGWRGSISE